MVLKCVYLVEVANGLIQDMPRKFRDAFVEISLDNSPLEVFEFIISCKIMLREFRVELELLKKARANESG